MQPVFERDIPELQGKTHRERIDLLRQASRTDRRIVKRQVVLFAGLWLLLVLLMLLYEPRVLRSPLYVAAVFFGAGVPLLLYFRARWVTPLIREALRTDEVNPPEA